MRDPSTDREKFVATTCLSVGFTMGLWGGLQLVPERVLRPIATETVRGTTQAAFIAVPTWLPILSAALVFFPAFVAYGRWIAPPAEAEDSPGGDPS